MNFHKVKGQIFKVDFTAKERKAIDEAINEYIRKRIIEDAKKFDLYDSAVVIWTLHHEFGFGESRLKRAWDHICNDHRKLREEWELGAEDSGFACLEALKRDGIDFREWYENTEIKIVEVNDDNT